MRFSRNRIGRACGVGLITLLLAGCGAVAPLYMYGPVGVDENGQRTVQPEWADQPSLWRDFAIPTRAPLGIVRLNAFIPEGMITGPLGIQGYGDGRGYNANSDAFASRVSIELNFQNGVGRVLFNESCAEIPTTPWTTQKVCWEPAPIVWAIGQPGTNGFRVIANETPGAGVDIYLLMSAENAFAQAPGAGPLECSIDFGFRVWTDQGSVRASTWAPFNIPVDPYPSLEAYWYDGLGRAPVTLLQRWRSDRGPSSLCDQEYSS